MGNKYKRRNVEIEEEETPLTPEVEDATVEIEEEETKYEITKSSKDIVNATIAPDIILVHNNARTTVGLYLDRIDVVIFDDYILHSSSKADIYITR